MTHVPDMSPDTAPALELEGLERSWDGRPALRGLDLRLQPGRTVGLIGPDGAGKTTALRIACGLLAADAGHARVFGFDCLEQTASIRPLVGYMPQRFSLYPDLTVDENLRFFAELYGISRHDRLERRERLLAFSRLEPFVKRRAGALSGGMKQKLALACTLIHEPRLLLLDEPTTGVDPVSRLEFWALLGELSRSGMALCVSTPYMDEAARLDEVLLLHRGRVLSRGTPAEIAAAFPRRILAVQGAGAGQWKHRLETLPGVSVWRFGNELHVVHDGDVPPPALEALLAGSGLEVAHCAPTIEDTFFALVEQDTEAAL